MKAYPSQILREEMAFIAYHFHWGVAELFNLEHVERRHWCRSISAINRRLDGTPTNPFEEV
ncbi:DUF6760 family protein [Lysobacter rhizosphaerae]